MKKTIALLHPGEMGAAIGAGLIERGHRVVWASAGRGASTRTRAQNAGLEDVATLARAAQAADIYRRLEGFKDAAKPPALAEVTAALSRKSWGRLIRQRRSEAGESPVQNSRARKPAARYNLTYSISIK